MDIDNLEIDSKKHILVTEEVGFFKSNLSELFFYYGLETIGSRHFNVLKSKQNIVVANAMATQKFFRKLAVHDSSPINNSIDSTYLGNANEINISVLQCYFC